MPEVIVIGSGPNGLVAANYLADAGYQVLVLEAQETIGGAVASDRGVHPDFIHDLASTFQPLAAASPVIAALDLADYGLVRSKAPAVLGHPHVDDGWYLQLEDVEATAALLDEQAQGDGAVLFDMWEHWQKVGPDLVRALILPFPPIDSAKSLGTSWRNFGFILSMALPLNRLVSRFSGPAFPMLLAGNAGHSDMSNRLPGSGLMAMVLTMLGHDVGFVSPGGGTQQLSDSMARRLHERGGEIRTNAEVVRIETSRSSVVGVELSSGERIAAASVIACVSAPALYKTMLSPEVVPARVRLGMRRFEWDPGTFRVDWALASDVPWRDRPIQAPGTVHLADSREQIAQNLDLIRRGVVPAKPFIVGGQMTTTDSMRSPVGTEAVAAYTRIPQTFVSDQLSRLRGDWKDADCEIFADRMQQRFEDHAPGFSDRVIARRILGPHELEARNANLVNGAIGGGTQRLRNQLIFRPTLGKGGAETGVSGLYLGSASAHPGGGVHGGPGHAAAQASIAYLHARSK